MIKLNNDELKEVQGGFGFWALGGIVSACIFIVGVIDGQIKLK